jgi:hypothetical protein
MNSTKDYDSPFGAAILAYLEGKQVEVYCGDTDSSYKYSESDENDKSVVCGIVKDVHGDALVLECTYGKRKNLVFINCWSIKTVIEVNSSSIRTFNVFNSSSKRMKLRNVK